MTAYLITNHERNAWANIPKSENFLSQAQDYQETGTATQFFISCNNSTVVTQIKNTSTSLGDICLCAWIK